MRSQIYLESEKPRLADIKEAMAQRLGNGCDETEECAQVMRCTDLVTTPVFTVNIIYLISAIELMPANGAYQFVYHRI
jgi:hypothetical protein